MNIKSAKLVNYNANARGKRTGDCVKRALSLAFGISYAEVEKELNARGRDYLEDHHYGSIDGIWKRPSVYNQVIAAHGGSSPIIVDPKAEYKLSDFVDEVLPPTGTFLVTTGKKPDTFDHIVCVIDGNIYDSWNSKNEYVYNYYKFRDDVKVERKSEVDISKLSYTEVQDLLDDMDFSRRIRAKALSMLQKRGYKDATFDISSLAVINYKISLRCRVLFPPYAQYADTSKERLYRFSLDVVCSPFETLDSIEEKVSKVIDVRLYDRMYAIFQNENKVKEALEVQHQITDEHTKTRLNSELYLSEYESKVFRSLPGWVQGLATYFSISKYRGSIYYSLSILPLPEDEMGSVRKSVNFYAYDIHELRDKLEEYKDTHREPSW